MQNLRFLDFRCSSKTMCPYELYYCNYFLADKNMDVADLDVDDLDVYDCDCPYCLMDEVNENKVQVPQGLEFSSFDIRYFRWFRYPLDSLPSNFEMRNLVALIMPSSKIKHLWNDDQHLEKLKHINLAHSECLIRIPNLSSAPNLESLNLEGCASLIEVDSSIRHLKKLVILNLKGCKNLGSLPTNIQSKLLEYLILSGCSNLKEAPKIRCNVIKAYFDGTSITEFPSIEHPSRLVVLNLEGCSRLESLSSDIFKLTTVKKLSLTGCSNLHRFPVRELQRSILSLHNLEQLTLRGCRCQDLVDSGWPFSLYLSSLWVLDLSHCQITRLPDSLGQLSFLGYLNLRGNNFEWIPSSIKDCTRLHFLDVSHCERLVSLPELQSGFQKLVAYNCTSLKSSSWPIMGSVTLNFGNCFKLDNRNILLEATWKKALRKIILPGNEIPEWLSFQNVGSSITLELSLKSGRPLRTVMCLLVTFPDHNKDCSVPYKLITVDQYGKTEVEEHDHPLRLEGFHLMSDHVILMNNYTSLLWVLRCKRRVTFDFSGGNYTVKKCGIKLFTEEDAIEEQLKQYEGHFSSNMEEEPQPKRRKL